MCTNEKSFSNLLARSIQLRNSLQRKALHLSKTCVTFKSLKTILKQNERETDLELQVASYAGAVCVGCISSSKRRPLALFVITRENIKLSG